MGALEYIKQSQPVDGKITGKNNFIMKKLSILTLFLLLSFAAFSQAVVKEVWVLADEKTEIKVFQVTYKNKVVGKFIPEIETEKSVKEKAEIFAKNYKEDEEVFSPISRKKEKSNNNKDNK